MTNDEYRYVASNITKLEEILRIMPEDRQVERMGVEYMIAKARSELEGVPIPPRPVAVNVAFSGEPVSRQGIDAAFAGKTTTAFAELTAITIAASTGPLEDTGGIPHRGLGQQLISGVTAGSFGFQIQLPPSVPAESGGPRPTSTAESAIETIQDLLEGALTAGDNDLAELTARIHPRAVKKMAEFLSIVKNNRAQTSVALNGRVVGLKNTSEVERATSRLAPANIEESTIEVIGTLIGVIPLRRRFQFANTATDDTLEGRVGMEIPDLYELAAQYTNRRVAASMRRIRVGQGQPKYILLNVVEYSSHG